MEVEFSGPTSEIVMAKEKNENKSMELEFPAETENNLANETQTRNTSNESEENVSILTNSLIIHPHNNSSSIFETTLNTNESTYGKL